MARRSRRARFLAISGILTVACVLVARRPVTMALAGSGMDPAIPVDLRVPPSVNAELAEHSRIFEKKVHQVGNRVYCAVGYGLANINFVVGEGGVIVVDTGDTTAQATEVLAELRKVTTLPVAAVVLTHHHADHVLGTPVFVTAEDVASERVPVFAHDSLVARYVDETGVTAELQAVRSMHMYGLALLPADREGSNAGIGPFLGRGEGRFLAPNRTFSDRLDVTVAGVRMEMRHVLSEAESEIAVFLPDEKILLSAEVIQDHTFPNLYTIRGARHRDPVVWVRSIDLLRAWGAESMVLQHGPPVLGHDEVARVLTHYRDQIQYVHDQTVRAMNQGLTPEEIAERVVLPAHLGGEKPWGREYYGTVKHSVRNIYGGYEGWFQGDPVALDPTPEPARSSRLVGMMGGHDAVLASATRAFSSGEHQFAAELATMLIHINTSDMDARHLKAAAFRKLGYAQVNASWRNYYLVSAMELDDQIPTAIYLHESGKKLGTAMKGLPARSQLALLPVRLKAEGTLTQDLVVGVHYRDDGEDHTLHLRRGVLEVAPGKAAGAVFSVHVTRESMGMVLSGHPFEDEVSKGHIKVDGDLAAASQFFRWFEVPFTQKPEVVVR